MSQLDFDIAHTWDLAYGEDTAAQGTHVMIRLSRAGVIIVEEHMAVDEFLNLAHAFENVARGVQAFMDKPAHVPEHVPESRPQPTLPNPNVDIRTGKPVPKRRPNKKWGDFT
jgi:hypothetical protein